MNEFLRPPIISLAAGADPFRFLRVSSGSQPLLPRPDAPGLTRLLTGTDHNGEDLELSVVEERPLSIYLNSREVITQMTVGDYPEYLALGFLHNQDLLSSANPVTSVEHHADIATVVVRTASEGDIEDKLRRQIRTSGCAQGSMFASALAKVAELRFPSSCCDGVSTRIFHHIQHLVNRLPSLYLKAGAIHGCALFRGEELLAYLEDVGRHNAVDKIAGYMQVESISGMDKIFYTTGRLTSEMVIKCGFMGIPILLSRSGFTAWGVELARTMGLTLVGRLRGKRFVILSGGERVSFRAFFERVFFERTLCRRGFSPSPQGRVSGRGVVDLALSARVFIYEVRGYEFARVV